MDFNRVLCITKLEFLFSFPRPIPRRITRLNCDEKKTANISQVTSELHLNLTANFKASESERGGEKNVRQFLDQTERKRGKKRHSDSTFQKTARIYTQKLINYEHHTE